MYCNFTFKLFVAYLYSNICYIYIQIFVTEMALPSTPVNSIPNHGEKPERFNGTSGKKLSIVKLNPSCQIIHGNWLTFLLVINHYNVSGFSRGK